MKKIIVSSALLLSALSFAQKDELKALKKLYNQENYTAEDITNYKANVTKLETLATDEGDKIYTNFYKAMAPLLETNQLAMDNNLSALVKQTKMAVLNSPKNITFLAEALNATLDYEKKTGKKIYTDDIIDTIKNYKPEYVQAAAKLEGAQKYAQSSEMLYAIYKLDTKEPIYLYVAANDALNAQNNEKALEYFTELKKSGYTGEGTSYLATSKVNGQRETFNSKEDRDNAVKIGTHIKPEQEQMPSKKEEIDNQISALKNAILIGKANEYYKNGDKAKYQELISEAIKANPNDANLQYNLGVVSTESGNFADAEKYYKKAIEIKPDFYDAYLNYSDLKLKPDADLVKKINALGSSAADLKKYDDLKVQREKLFNEALPLLEKAHELKPDDADTKENLRRVYSFLGLKDKAAKLMGK